MIFNSSPRRLHFFTIFINLCIAYIFSRSKCMYMSIKNTYLYVFKEAFYEPLVFFLLLTRNLNNTFKLEVYETSCID
jgi:hypothetical protein